MRVSDDQRMIGVSSQVQIDSDKINVFDGVIEPFFITEKSIITISSTLEFHIPVDPERKLSRLMNWQGYYSTIILYIDVICRRESCNEAEI